MDDRDAPPRGRDGRPCKACFSFEDMLKLMGKQKQQLKTKEQQPQKQQNGDASTSSSSAQKSAEEGTVGGVRRRKDCPLDKDQLGRSTWDLLHTMSVYYPDKPTEQERTDMRETLNGISKTYPCDHCAADFRADLRDNPPALHSRASFARWMCEAHNRVNDKLGKRLFDCDRVMERWYDGWKDGSCDP